MPKVCVIEDGYEHFAVKSMFLNEGYSIVDDYADADIVCFVGGEDVSPALYNCHAHSSTRSNRGRDEYEALVYDECINLGVPMVGICRGGQFLNVMNGGGMYQDVNNHHGYHDAFRKDIGDNSKRYVINSIHHQMMRPNYTADHKILLLSGESTKRVEMPMLGTTKIDRIWHPQKGHMSDIEALFYPRTRCLCFQAHPEYGSPRDAETRELFFELIDDYINAL